jgi:5-methylcytosine-specific restriction enzyme A
VLLRFGRRCDPAGGCGRSIRPGDGWSCDHRVAIINGGQNRELNLRPLCSWCDPPKTAADVAEKSRVYRVSLKHAGIKIPPKGRPLIGTIASGWRRRFDGTWERRCTTTQHA